MKIVILSILLIIAFLFFTSRLCVCNRRDGFTEPILPDACVHMMETGFSETAVAACANYANRCGDKCEPYPMTTEEVKKLYAKLGVLPGARPSSEVDVKMTKMLGADPCIPGAGPGGPCVDGEEDCPFPYLCSNLDNLGNGTCQCPPEQGDDF